MKYKISIIIPVFNVEEYLDDAFQSIFSQTLGFDSLEVIFVDDCSTDNSGAIIDNYADKYENVISLHLGLNSGVAGKPRNVGMEYATSDYLMFLDPDDVFTKNACEILYAKAIKYDADIVGGLNTVFTSDGSKKIDSSYVYKSFTDINEKPDVRRKKTDEILNTPNFELKIDSYKDLNSIIVMYALWTKLFKTKLIKENDIKFAEFAPAEDSIFLLDAILHARGMVFVNDIIIEYNNIRTGDNKSVSHQISVGRLFERMGVYYKMYDISRDAGEEELFIRYLLISKLNYLLTNHLLLSRISNVEKRQVLEFIAPLFKECVKYKYAIPSNLKLFELIADDIDAAILEINRIIKSRRANNTFSVVINLDGSIDDVRCCLKNIFNQKYNDFEIICIIDESNIELYDFIQSYSKDDRLIFIANEINKSWVNLGLEYVHGNYVHFINVNNYFDDMFYKSVFKSFSEDNAEIVLCNSDNFELNNFKTLFGIKNNEPFDFSILSSIFDVSCNISNQIYRTTFLEEHYVDLFKNKIFFEDIFCYYYYLKANKAFCLENTFCHSKENINLTNFNFNLKYIDHFDYIINILKYQKDYELYEQKLWYNILFQLLRPFKNNNIEYLDEYYYELSALLNKYELFDKTFCPQLDFWLKLFKMKDYDYFIKQYEKLII